MLRCKRQQNGLDSKRTRPFAETETKILVETRRAEPTRFMPSLWGFLHGVAIWDSL
jgi:hypothetical protein